MAKKKKKPLKTAKSSTGNQSHSDAAAPRSQKLIGLNIYRAVAIFMMMAAHSIRIQENYATLITRPDTATLFDQFLLLFITIEPIISAMFLFIAGFSLTLSHRKIRHSEPVEQRAWLRKILQRAAALYGVAMVFFLAEYGFQWPDFLVSAGVLGTIALSIALSATLLLYSKSPVPLIVATLAVLLATYGLESRGWVVTGLNAGAGGHFPLLVMGFLGTLYGIGYQKLGDNGLLAGLLLSAIIAIMAFVIEYPNTFVYRSNFAVYSHSLPEQWLQSALHLFSGDGGAGIRQAGFWNHASVFPLRYSFVIMLFLVLAIKGIRHTGNKLLVLLNALGSYGLTIYVFHLVILAGMEVSGIKPVTGWQTLVLIFLLMASGYLLIRNRFSIDPG